MQIEMKNTGPCTVLELTGRLDVTWAEHFVNAAQEALRGGRHHLRADAAGLDYISSAGIRALIKVRRELTAVQGSFAVINPSAFVENTLRMSGLVQLLETKTETDENRQSKGSAETTAVSTTGAKESTGMQVNTHLLNAGAMMRAYAPCTWLPWSPVQDGNIIKVAFPENMFGIGIGAPGHDPQDARGRFGEFLAVAGCLSWHPSDVDDVPDYLVQADRFIPDLYAIQALTAEGEFSHLLRFHPTSKGNTLALSDLLAEALRATRSDAVSMVCIAEIDGLVGAALSRSPGLATETDSPAQFPDIRNWMAFCGERVHARQSAVLVAFAARHPDPALKPLLAPLPSRPDILAHVHAVVLPFRPLQEGTLDLHASVNMLFGEVEPLDLVHLIEDNRPVMGLGQSTFIRGACWCAPLRFGKEG